MFLYFDYLFKVVELQIPIQTRMRYCMSQKVVLKTLEHEIGRMNMEALILQTLKMPCLWFEILTTRVVLKISMESKGATPPWKQPALLRAC